MYVSQLFLLTFFPEMNNLPPQCYWKALESEGRNMLSRKDQREILVNRSYVYLLQGDPYTASRDIAEALSERFLESNVVEALPLTARCHYILAAIKLKMTHYEEAMEEYRLFEDIVRRVGGPLKVEKEQKETLKEIEEGLAVMKSSKKWPVRRIKLIRAVQVYIYCDLFLLGTDTKHFTVL
jgi:hypothetical protein